MKKTASARSDAGRRCCLGLCIQSVALGSRPLRECLVAEVYGIFDDGGKEHEDLAPFLGVELGCAVVVVDTVLLLLDVSDLCVAEADDMLGGLEGFYLSAEDLEEFFFAVDVAAIAP